MRTGRNLILQVIVIEHLVDLSSMHQKVVVYSEETSAAREIISAMWNLTITNRLANYAQYNEFVDEL